MILWLFSFEQNRTLLAGYSALSFGARAVSSLGVSEGICTSEHAAGDGWSNGDALGGAVSQEEGAGLPRVRSDMLWEPIYLVG